MYLIKLLDGGIKDVVYEEDFISGCPTCDYGSIFIDNFNVVLTSSTIHVKIESSNRRMMSESFIIRFFIKHLNEIKECAEEDFPKFLQDTLDEDLGKLDGYEWSPHYVLTMEVENESNKQISD